MRIAHLIRNIACFKHPHLIGSIVTEEDADRVWSCVENAVQVMAEAEEDEDD